MATQVSIQANASDGLRVNSNRICWDDVYLKIRKLCVIKGEKIRKYAPEFSGNPRKTIQFIKGEVKVNQTFWDSLKPAHKTQLRMLINQISKLYTELENAHIS